MRRSLLLLVLLGSLASWPLAARAGADADALAQCLIHATTPADQTTVLRWAFATMALDPDVASMATVTSAQRAAINQRAGTLVTNLLVQSCSDSVQRTLMFEGIPGVQTAFEAWGRWAIAGLVSEPHVAAGMSGLLEYIDIGKLMTLMPLQGLPPASGSTH